jgi:putative ABC transport system permease protein
METVKGRDFSKAYGTDSSGLIINESAAAVLGNDNPIGKKLYMPDGAGTTTTFQIIGVVKNFHFASLRENIGPLCFRLGNSTSLTSFKVNTPHIEQLVKQVENKWKAMAPGMPFSYRFLDQSFDNMYRAEQRVGNISLSFAALAICIACLGLFGLAAFAAEQRTKEIGIRKVLGASISNIIGMLSKDFLKLVIVAALIAFPVAWWAMHTWLQDFAFRVNISWWVFVLAGAAAVLIAIVTVSFQAIKAALANPVKALKTE